MRLTPLKVTMLCEIHWNPHFKPPQSQAQIAAMHEFEGPKLVRPSDQPEESNLSLVELTERGKAFLALILATPLPEAATGWKDPRTGDLIL